MAAKPIPDDQQTVTPYLTIDGAADAIDFYERAFGAKLRTRMDAPGGKVGHAALEIGGSVVMLADAFPQATTKSPKEVGGASASLFLFSEDVDATVRRCADAGATVVQEPEDQFWGDRMGTIVDPFGHVWAIATHIEDLSEEEIAERGREAMAAMGG